MLSVGFVHNHMRHSTYLIDNRSEVCINWLYSKASYSTALNSTDLDIARFWIGSKITQTARFLIVNKRSNLILHGFSYFTLLTKLARFLNNMVFCWNQKQCYTRPCCICTTNTVSEFKVKWLRFYTSLIDFFCQVACFLECFEVEIL